ncbi:hypothetical protein M2150_001028 [Lachnospiraceae bacterium PM6-15]|uniref:hypothetical protein n=1 Tax=Ohessyouella blattaphilus TaxID=2949333 RepID=UPI003E3138EA
MKKSTYRLLTRIPVYGDILRNSDKGEVMLCSPLLSDLSREGIDVVDIFEFLEEKYPGEVVTEDRFLEGYREVKSKIK